jgi:hypothetical protein
MPLIVSPIDNQTPMQRIVRDGIEIDRCPVSGGIWLDRGELEKLLAQMQQAVVQDRDEYSAYRHEHPQHAPRQMPTNMPPRGYRYDDDDYDDYHKRKYGKKSKFKTLLDIFD